MSEGPHSECPCNEAIMYVSLCFHLFKIRFVSIKACEALACPEIPDILLDELVLEALQKESIKVGLAVNAHSPGSNRRLDGRSPEQWTFFRYTDWKHSPCALYGCKWPYFFKKIKRRAYVSGQFSSPRDDKTRESSVEFVIRTTASLLVCIDLHLSYTAEAAKTKQARHLPGSRKASTNAR